jgi:cyclophilin family peptidyl-prolyl cis-trans isomerase
MASYIKRVGWVSVTLGYTATLGLMLGCNQKPPSGGTASQGASASPAAQVVLDPRMHQPFAAATLTDPPQDSQLPPATTFAGLSVGKLYEQVRTLWDDVKYVSPAGKRLTYRAILDTKLGAIEIVLRPDWAPNHVRSFIALAKAHYYDGLVFERTIHNENPDGRLDMIEAGGPQGLGDLGEGSIGYWLKPETAPEAKNVEGAVGACHVSSDGMDACRFYITLIPEPAMDGDTTVFGTVTRGLDVARTILSLPLANEGSGQRPQEPVVIRSVTIETSEVEK